MRQDQRAADQLRPIVIRRPFASAAPGSVLMQAGQTVVLCTAAVSEEVPPWKTVADPPSGWVTAEYAMLPGSTSPRKPRDRGRPDGRAMEIQRLIGRSLRAVVDLVALGPRTITVDCDVLQADGGTRTLSITGGFIALVDAVAAIDAPGFDPRSVFRDSVAAVSTGIVEGQILLDLDYAEDSRAQVDQNVVMTGSGRLIEVQATAERGTFSLEELTAQLMLAQRGIRELTELQWRELAERWPLDTPGRLC